MINKISLVLGIVNGILISFLLPYTNWFQFFIPVIVFPLTYYGLILLFFITIGIISLTINTKKEYEDGSRFHLFITLLTMELLINLARINLIVKGKNKVPTKGKYMLVYNHKSNYDPIIQSYILRKTKLVHISKPSNFKIPIAGPFIKRSGFLSIDRDNSKKALNTIIKAIKYISSDSFSVGVSPEGTRNKNDGYELLPFRKGCFKIALKAECPIVICTMKNATKIHTNFPWKRTNVEMEIIDVLSYNDIKDLDTNEISDIVKNKMLNNLEIKEN